MNGRVYDPITGRFTSADPIIQAPYNSQSYNRYSYVWNNPLSATDPSGFVRDLPGVKTSRSGMQSMALWGSWDSGWVDWKDTFGLKVTVTLSNGMQISVPLSDLPYDMQVSIVNSGYSVSSEVATAIAGNAMSDSGWAGSSITLGGSSGLSNLDAIFEAKWDAAIKSGAMLAECGPCMAQDRMYEAYMNGEITRQELREFRRAQAAGGLIGLGVLGVSLTARTIYFGGLYLWKNLSFDGPSAGVWYAQGRIFGVRWKKSKLGIRLDLHSRAPGGPPVLHINYGSSRSGENNHIDIWTFGGK